MFNTYVKAINIGNVKDQISKKKEDKPYIATSEQQVFTDYDIFPYTRFYQGVPTSSEPIFADREAGWRPINQERYKKDIIIDDVSTKPNICFQAACSTSRPCYPKSDREDLNNVFNSACNVQYR
jgi:hypothetical protein